MRSILHSDLNNFYASVEILLNPELRGKPVAVCGDKSTRHGIVLAKSEEAKRTGVKTAMAIWEAQNCCPDLLIIPPHFEEYRRCSQEMRQIYLRYTDLVESFGLDECWLDVSASGNQGRRIAEEIRAAAKREVGLTVSIGVSFNKVFAKLGSDMKKPDAITEIPYDRFQEIVWPLPAGDMLGIGPKTSKRLQMRNICTIGDVARCDRDLLSDVFGAAGRMMWRYANGLDDSPVTPADYARERKSVGHGKTTSVDMYNNADVHKLVVTLVPRICEKLRDMGMRASTVEISYRDNTLTTRSNQARLVEPTQSAKALAEAAMDLFRRSYDWDKPLMSFTVTAKDLVPEDAPRQLSFFDAETAKKNLKQEDLEKAVARIRARFGEESILSAASLAREESSAGEEERQEGVTMGK